MAGGADDVHDAGGGGELRQGERRGRDGEFDQAVGILQQRRDVARNFDAVGAKARELAGIAADHGRTRRLDRAGKRDALGRRDGVDQRAPHTPAGAGDHQPHVGICGSHETFSVRRGYSGSGRGEQRDAAFTSPARGEVASGASR